MAENVLSFVVETIGNLLIEEGRFLHGVKDQADQLHAELKRMQSFLKDADARQNQEGGRLREWVSQTRDLAYEAEHLLECYAFKIESSRGRGVTSIIKRCACLVDECLTRHQVGSDIESLKAKIFDLTRSFNEYGITATMEKERGSISRQQLLRRTYSHVAEEDLVGVESQVELLAKELVGESYRLVSICGMGGLGKTTLARIVYHHPNVRHHFESFSWVCVSQQYQTRDLLEEIFTKFMPMKENIKKLRDTQLVKELYEFQQDRKCLVVIDDIWSIEAWNAIKDAFPIREVGSKVLLTTRNREVATHIDPRVFLHQPQVLDQKESWELFQRKSQIQSRFQGDGKIYKMEKLGKAMVEYCGGLPLAIIVLGAILATKESSIEWEKVHKNIQSYLGKGNNIGEEGGGLQNILELSYNDLPYQLKPCFLYLSKYLEDENIKTEALYQIWMAEGMISMEDRIGDEPMMDVAERYLEELAKRYMVFVELEELPSTVKFKSCRLHDLMRDLCLLKAKEENFLELIDYRNRNGAEVGDFTRPGNRRLVIHLRGEDDEKFVPPRKGVRQRLRSFVFSLDDREDMGGIVRKMKFLIGDFKMLRVLSIEGLSYSGGGSCWEGICLALDHISIPLGELIHLRYLRLRDCDFIIIPSSVSKLKHLETLDLCYSRISRIPNAIRKLRRLKHLYLPDEPFCRFRLDGLHNLEILEGFDSRRNDVIHLSTLTNLRSLTASISDKAEDVEEFINQVNKLTYLRFLSLDIQDCDFSSEKGSTVLRKLFSCNPLSRLKIGSGRISKLPEYKPCFSPNLHELTLWEIETEEDPMRTLEKLPNLESLTLAYCGVEEIMCHATGFPHLKFLELKGLGNLKNWQIEEGAMPNLSSLKINQCQNLKMIPAGLRFVTTLKELQIVDMPGEFKSRLQVREDGREGEDFDKVQHVPRITFEW